MILNSAYITAICQRGLPAVAKARSRGKATNNSVGRGLAPAGYNRAGGRLPSLSLCFEKRPLTADAELPQGGAIKPLTPGEVSRNETERDVSVIIRRGGNYPPENKRRATVGRQNTGGNFGNYL